MIGFEIDIRPLFRQEDRDEMAWAFDLWSFDDVKAHAVEILQRLQEGTMPCDEPWDDVQVDRFREWTLEGYGV